MRSLPEPAETSQEDLDSHWRRGLKERKPNMNPDSLICSFSGERRGGGVGWGGGGVRERKCARKAGASERTKFIEGDINRERQSGKEGEKR